MEQSCIEHEQNLKQKYECNYLALPKEIFFTNSLEGLRESGLSLKAMDACVNLLTKRWGKSLRWLGMVPSFILGWWVWGKKNNGVRLEISWAGLGTGPACLQASWKMLTYTAWIQRRLEPIAHNLGKKEAEEHYGTSMVVQWLRLCLPTQRTWVWSLVGELRSHTLGGK